MSTLLRSGTPCPRLTSLDKLRQGSLPPDPSLTDLCDGTEAMTHRNAVSKPRCPSQQGADAGLSQEQTPSSPASHWTGMPRQPLHDAQRRVPLHMTSQVDERRARSLPSRPRLTRPSTLMSPMPPPCPRRAAASETINTYSCRRIAALPPPGQRAGDRPHMHATRGQAPCRAMPRKAPVPARRHDPTLSATTLAPWWTGPLRGRPRGRYAALVVGRGRLTHESPPPKGRDK